MTFPNRTRPPQPANLLVNTPLAAPGGLWRFRVCMVTCSCDNQPPELGQQVSSWGSGWSGSKAWGVNDAASQVCGKIQCVLTCSSAAGRHGVAHCGSAAWLGTARVIVSPTGVPGSGYVSTADGAIKSLCDVKRPMATAKAKPTQAHNKIGTFLTAALPLRINL